MQLKPAIRKATELGIALTAVATLVLAGCGGKSSSGSAAADMTTLSISPSLGRFSQGASVRIRDRSGIQIGSGYTDASGVASIAVPTSAQAPLLVEAGLNGDRYYDEKQGLFVSVSGVNGVAVRALVPDHAVVSQVAVTALTEIAVGTLANASGVLPANLSAASAVGANTAVEQSFGVNNLLLPPKLVGTPADIAALGSTAPADMYAAKLAGLAYMAGTNEDALKVAHRLRANLSGATPASSVAAVITAMNTALSNMPSAPWATINASKPTALPSAPALQQLMIDAAKSAHAAQTQLGAAPTAAQIAQAMQQMKLSFQSNVLPAMQCATGCTSFASAVAAANTLAASAIMPVRPATQTCPTGQTLNPAGVCVATTTTSGAPTVPAAPTGVTATSASATQINLSWTAVTGATKYNIYRASSAGVALSAGNKINTGNVTATAFNSTGLLSATLYYYVVTAVNASGESVGSAEVTATTNAVPAGVTVPTTAYAPQQTTNLQFALFGTVANPPLAGQIRVFSSAAAASETINIYRSTSPNVAITPANLVTPVPINTKTVYGAGSWWFSFDDTGLAAGTKYYYRTTLVNAAGEGPGSIEMVGRTPLATIGAGAGLTLSAAFKGKTTVPNVIPYESSSSSSFASYFSDSSPSRGFYVGYLVDPINGDLLYFYLIDTAGGTDKVELDVASALKQCAITTATGYTACSTLGVTFDRAAGSITFVSTPMKATSGATTGSMFNITGTLNFTPF
ncbi:MAG: hypothetical protein EPO42_05345 [Gallionellaceae bacterium]|nr:MAG: hypothetical protein EPO42_05345 [Gallionellaceae bacterium]